jgi:hypothetical protein
MVGLGMLTASGSAVAGLVGAAEAEHARMNALAGGPTNAYDADLLERYGCYSGARSVCVPVRGMGNLPRDAAVFLSCSLGSDHRAGHSREQSFAEAPQRVIQADCSL